MEAGVLNRGHQEYMTNIGVDVVYKSIKRYWDINLGISDAIFLQGNEINSPLQA